MSSSSSSPLNPSAQAGSAPPATPSTRDIIEGWIRELKRDSTGSTLPTPVSAETIISHIRSTLTESINSVPVRAALEGNIELLRELYEAAGAYTDPNSTDGLGTVLTLGTQNGPGINYKRVIRHNVIPSVCRFPDKLKDLAEALSGIVLALLELVPTNPLTGEADELDRDELYKFVNGIVAGIVGYSANSTFGMFGGPSAQLRARESWDAEGARIAVNRSDSTSSDDSYGASGVVPSSPQSKPPSDIGSVPSSEFNDSRIRAQSSPRQSLAPLNSNQTRARSHSPKLGATNVDDGVLVRKGSRQSSRSRSGSISADINEVFVSTIQKELAKKNAQMTQRDVEICKLQEELKYVRELAKIQVAHVTASLEKEQRERERERARFQEERERARAMLQEQIASLERERERERAMFQEQTASLNGWLEEGDRERRELNRRLEEGDRERRELTKEFLAVLKPKNVA